MANGIYVAASGTMSRLQEMRVVANNLAHADATGFKRDQVTFRSVQADERGPRPPDDDKDFVQTRPTNARLESGPMTRTNNPLDVAISGAAFLRVETPRGERLTRNGRMMIGRDGMLRTLTGNPVLNNKGKRIHLPPDRAPEINEAGRVRSGELQVADLGLRRVNLDGVLDKDEAGLFVPPEPGEQDLAGQPDFTVLQGWVEESNVDAVGAMTDMVELQRTYEALHQVMTTYREMDQTATQLPG
ncbi:MAG: flagellar hook basal-body protein [Myxococcota bacterium]